MKYLLMQDFFAEITEHVTLNERIMAKKAVVPLDVPRETAPQKNSLNAKKRMQKSSYLYLRSLTVRNVRCFGDEPQTLHLSTSGGLGWAQWTIILGNNGTGKSTLLQLLDSVDKKQLGYPNSQDSTTQPFVGFTGQVLQRGSPFLRADTDQIREASNQFVPYEIRKSTARVDMFLQSDAELSTDIGSEPIRAWVSWSRFVTEARPMNLYQVVPELKHFGYGAWRRLGQSSLAVGLESGKDWASHLFDDNVALLDAEEWLQRIDYSASKPSEIRHELSQRFELVRATLIDILPDIDDIRISPPSKEHSSPRVLFRTPYGEVQLRQLGFGYQSLISWVVDFAARMFEAYPESPNPLAEPAVCLVDEIDLHLHPSWQRKVMKYLSERFPKTQFIATAHSPLIVQAAPEIGANVAVLHREGDHVVISNNPIDVQGWRADQILSSELFDNQPLRSPEIQSAIDERTRLLAKQKLTTKDQKRLVELDAIVDELPVGSTPDERNIAAQLKAAASLLDRVTSRKS